MSDLVKYQCRVCPAHCIEALGSIWAMLKMCRKCQEKRYATGLAAQRKAVKP